MQNACPNSAHCKKSQRLPLAHSKTKAHKKPPILPVKQTNTGGLAFQLIQS